MDRTTRNYEYIPKTVNKKSNSYLIMGDNFLDLNSHKDSTVKTTIIMPEVTNSCIGIALSD